MLKIAVVGGAETVIGFKALGLEACPVANVDEARETLRRLTRDSEDYAIIYLRRTTRSSCSGRSTGIRTRPSPRSFSSPAERAASVSARAR